MKIQLDSKQMIGFQILDAGSSRIAAKIAGKPGAPMTRLAVKSGAKSRDASQRVAAKISTKPMVGA